MKLAPRHDQRRDAGARAAVEVSIVMPCLNEAETIARCIQKAQRSAEKLGLSAEVIVADNGSTDGSPVIARELGARVMTLWSATASREALSLGPCHGCIAGLATRS